VKDNYSNSNLIQIIPTLDNTYEKLSNLKEVEISKKLSKVAKAHNVSTYSDTCKRKPVGNGAGKSVQNILLTNSVTNGLLGSDGNEGAEQVAPQKVVIIGDSHARGCASILKCSLEDNYKVIGYVKPGASIDTLVSSAKRDIVNLNKNDVIVFWGGSGDISKNNTQKGLRQLELVDFVKKIKHTNIVLMSVPHRHDLAYWSCVNKEVETFNRKLLKFIKPLEHVKVITVEYNREYFTRHGMHLNNEGKEQVVRKVANVITTRFREQIEKPIGLHWMMEHDEGASLKFYGDGGITISETTATASKELQGNNGQDLI
jgi:hypothetical protein